MCARTTAALALASAVGAVWLSWGERMLFSMAETTSRPVVKEGPTPERRIAWVLGWELRYAIMGGKACHIDSMKAFIFSGLLISRCATFRWGKLRRRLG